MIANQLDRPVVRFALGTFIGLPISAATVIGSLYSVIFLYGGIIQADLRVATLGAGGILGTVGVLGAWRRLLKRSTEMSEGDRKTARLMLKCGVIGALVLALWCLFAGFWLGVFGSVAFALFGVALRKGTPLAS